MYIDPKYIIGKKYDILGNTYECIGYCQNSTALIIGCYFDAPNNRTALVTHKLADVRFMGDITK